MHLNAEELVDVAEGTRPESAAPHLAGCESCRAQLRELRAMLSAAQERRGAGTVAAVLGSSVGARVRGGRARRLA